MAQKVSMALNKKQTPGWMKGVIIFIAVTFVIGFIPIALAGFGGSSKPGNTGDPASATSIAAKYQPTLDALNASLQANPENVDMLIQQGHTYYEYAAELTNAGLTDAAAPLWATAISIYDKVLAAQPTNAVVLGNRAFASYYSNSPNVAAALEAFIATNDATLASQIETAKEMLTQVNSAQTTDSATATGAP